MIISHNKKFIFFCNGKVASSSIELALQDWDETSYEQFPIHGLFSERHMPPAIAQSLIHKELWNSYFKFTFVRNPYDWFVSSYKYNYRFSPGRWFMESVRNPLLAPYRLLKIIPFYRKSIKTHFEESDVDDMITRLRRVRGLPHTESLMQTSYTQNINGDTLVDFIGKYEDLQHDFNKLTNTLGIDASLQYINRSLNRKSNKRISFSKETRDKIYAYWEIDFKNFEYSKDLPKKFDLV
jgi:hypothetical protein